MTLLTRPNEKSNLLGFNFYGSGNIGDDLMLDGFLAVTGLDADRVHCILGGERRISTLRCRFPSVEWTSSAKLHYRIWMGVGDTPVQASSGPWCLNSLRDSLTGTDYECAVMVGVGVEQEAVTLASGYRPLLRRMSLIGTRDERSAELLIREFGCGWGQIVVGADLAHACPALQSLARAQPLEARKYSLGVTICGGDGLPRQSLRVFRDWLLRRDLTKTVVLPTDVRSLPYGEVDLHRRWTTKSRWRRRPKMEIEIVTPDYWKASSVGRLVEHFADVQSLISSRYHGIVIGAWAGCRLAVIARGSKVETLARELDIPSVGRHFTTRDLDRIHEEARPVSLKKLEALAHKAGDAALAITKFAYEQTI